MGTYAVIRSGIVENLVVWDGKTNFSPEGCEVVKATSDAHIGGSWDGNVFTFIEPDPGPDTRPYDEKRKAEYPSIEECVHAMLDDGLVELQEKRAAVKAKYPKGGSA